jgi:hypothetical protein
VSAQTEAAFMAVVELLEAGRKSGEFQIDYGHFTFHWARGLWTVIDTGKIITRNESLAAALEILFSKTIFQEKLKKQKEQRG